MIDLALIRLSDGAVLRVFPAGTSRLDLPGGAAVMPPMAGWRGGGEISYVKDDSGEIAMEGEPRYAIVEIERNEEPKEINSDGEPEEEMKEGPENAINHRLELIEARLDAIEAAIIAGEKK